MDKTQRSFEEEILELDRRLEQFRERLRTDEEFRREIEAIKKYMFAEE